MGQLVHLDNAAFRAVKAATPGAYTFILPATPEVPKRFLHPKKRTVGVRIPDHRVVSALLAELDEPLLSSTLILPGQDDAMTQGWAIKEELDQRARRGARRRRDVVGADNGRRLLLRRGRGDPGRRRRRLQVRVGVRRRLALGPVAAHVRDPLPDRQHHERDDDAGEQRARVVREPGHDRLHERVVGQGHRLAVDDREQQRDPEQQERRHHPDPEEPARVDGERDADAQGHEADVEGPAEPARHEHVGGDQEDANGDRQPVHPTAGHPALFPQRGCVHAIKVGLGGPRFPAARRRTGREASRAAPPPPRAARPRRAPAETRPPAAVPRGRGR